MKLKLHTCWKHGEWCGFEGKILQCKKCGEMIGYQFKEIYDQGKIGFTPMMKQAQLHEKEIREMYGIER